VRSRASSFKWEYSLLSLRSSSSFLRLLPHLLVTSISPFIFPSITCFRRQFLRKMWPIQLVFRFLISCRIFLCSLTLNNTIYNYSSIKFLKGLKLQTLMLVETFCSVCTSVNSKNCFDHSGLIVWYYRPRRCKDTKIRTPLSVTL
jgi:hypothetical protein